MSQFATAPHPIRRVLIANRGEIACRIIRTCRRLGIWTIAVYSDVDAAALHVRSADETARIGPAPAAQSYLSIGAILDAARRTGADAIHPGYGFLSENAAFARACREAGLIYIGPSAEAIAAMGSKIEAKKVAQAAGVPTVPGYHGDDQSPARLTREARRIGFPVLIKAAHGGGGRGMRRVDKEGELVARLSAARSEAASAFGDDSVLLEKLIAKPRHLEVQLVGDAHSNLVHLFERDCSVQRNNQKVFEEAPAPNLPEAVRQKLYAHALQLGKAIGYTSAGTVEFVMEAGSDEPYFLEMNTRLQVEHPVTEAITGVDLVEWQLRVAAGLSLPAGQNEIRRRGHAIEARIAAERPEQDFQPAIGRITHLAAPTGARFDTGIAGGSEIGIHYDSMVAKLIAYGDNRQAAVDKLDAALAHLSILGVATNIGMLRACIARPAFTAGQLTTAFLATEFPRGWSAPADAVDRLAAAAALAWIEAQTPDATALWQQSIGFRVMGRRRPAQVELTVANDQSERTVTVLRTHAGFAARIGDQTWPLSNDETITAVEGNRVMVAQGGLTLDASIGLSIAKLSAIESKAEGETRLVTPLPGVVTGLFTSLGASVRKGDNLIQLEAMKLVHTLQSPADGRVGKVLHAIGEAVAAGATLIEIIPKERK
ncbi:MAG: hypothetical protein K2X43_00405 [Hyphomonadaceae bacterium]|nr:hypothetical protein [Hyphomonadaceae bacterium]